MKYLFFFGSISLVLLLLLLQLNIQAQEKKYPAISMEPFGDSMRHWYGIADKGNIVNPKANQPRYPETEIIKIADNILLYQRDNGGWPKNYDMQAILTDAQKDSLFRTRRMTHTTFDNSTTFTHIEYLAKVFRVTRMIKYRDACLRGLSFVLKAQYDNGGWPQYFPLEKGDYSTHITFNDGAYIGVMRLLQKIVENHPDFTFIDSRTRQQVKKDYTKGIECILKTQIRENGKLYAWCQQHDEVTLQPAWARAFEPPSICNGESSGIVLFLMNLPHPSQEVIESVRSAVQWFRDSRIFHIRVETVYSPPEKSQWRSYSSDRVVVVDSLAPPTWTRYYELKTHRPLFCDRNSKLLYSLAEVSHERRAGYAWYTYAPQEVLDKYLSWHKKWVPDAGSAEIDRFRIEK